MAKKPTYEELEKRIYELERETSKLTQKEKDLAACREKLKSFYEYAPLPYQALDENGCLLEVNPSWIKELGYSHEEVVGRWFGDFLVPEDVDRFQQFLPRFKADTQVCGEEFEMVRKDGSALIASFNGQIEYGKEGRFKQTHCVFQNITGSKQVETSLRKSEDKYRKLVENINDMIYMVDKDGIITYVSPAVEQIMDFRPNEVVGSNFNKFVYKEDLPVVIKRFKKVMSGHLAVAHYRLVSKSGTIHWLRSSSRPIIEDNRVVGLQGVVIDFTELKRIENSLRTREKALRVITDNVPALISYVDADGYYRFVNKGYEEWFRISKEEIIGEHFRQFLGDSTHKRMQKYVQEVLSGTKVNYEEMLPYKFGGTRWIHAKYVPDIDKKGKVRGFFSLVSDISARKKIENTLRKKENKLKLQAQHLEELNTSLKVILEHRNQEKKEIEKNIMANVKKLLFPYIEMMRKSRLNNANKTLLSIIKSNLQELISPFTISLSSKYSALTPTEIHIADFIRQGQSSKEIASLLNVSYDAVCFHRKNIRKKLGITHSKANLSSYLSSLPR